MMIKELKKKGKVVGYSLSHTMNLSPEERQELKRICDYFNCDDWYFMLFAFCKLLKKALEFMEDHPDEKDAELGYLDDELFV